MKSPSREELSAWTDADYEEAAREFNRGDSAEWRYKPQIDWDEFSGRTPEEDSVLPVPTFGPGEEERFRLYRRHFERLCRAIFESKGRVHVDVRRNGKRTVYFKRH